MLMKRIDHGESGFSLMKPSMHGFAAHVEQKVVHPPHVPFQPESQATQIGGSGNTGPSGRFFRDGHDSRKPLIANFVEAFHEINGIEVFASAMDVRYPFSLFAR